MLAINEVFYSLQGEGRYAGTPMVFIRLAGCNLRCSWCDQPDTIAEGFVDRLGVEWRLAYDKMPEVEVVEKVTQHPTRHVCLTGGEPTTHKLYDLISRLLDINKLLHIETNGTVCPTWIRLIKHICVSPKRGFDIDPTMLGLANDLKFIVDDEFTMEEAEKWRREKSFQGQAYLQPCNFKDTWHPDSVKKCVELVKAYPQYKLSLHLHKILGVR
jgi:7-carboxy-7-deazaguanine synthase